ncbi:MAG TPA: hypothetical protein VHW64_09400 [Nocardioides sp.]|jgi:hypothetical protein|uniref:hypothetical protein n=1 Tax=Nocardioides sp. TaxID=35761 RepID=UPI002E308105|nr:hypothetical protein [Nocardioides sp.]HEX3930908.1 hypothetical protein [Nocardioides sp.]
MDKPPPFQPVIRSQSDVEGLWRRLMNPLGFSSCSLWLVVIEDDLPLPQITEFSEMPDAPDPELAQKLGEILERLVEPDTSFAFLRTRPGGGTPTPDDLGWARVLHDAGRRIGAPLQVTHLAHDHDVVPLVLDDLLAEPA